MNQLGLSDELKLIRNCLINAVLASAERSESVWTFRFGNGSSISVETLWRLVSHEMIVLTSDDDGQQFGLKRTIDAASELEAKLAGQRITDVSLDSATSDLTMSFTEELRLQILNTSSGFEAWGLSGEGLQVIGRNGDRVTFRQAQKE